MTRAYLAVLTQPEPEAVPRRRSLLLVWCFVALATVTDASARTVKIGILLPVSGAAAEFGARMRQGVDLAVEERHGKIGGHTVEIVVRDTGDASPQRVRQLAQELVVRERVDLLGGLDTTPAVLAVADVVNKAKIPFVIFSPGTSGLTKKSEFFVRAGYTQWALSYPLGKWLGANGKKRMAMIVADYAPGYDSAASFAAGFAKSGGIIVETLKVPLGTSDPSSYLQRIQVLSPDGVFMFLPGPFGVNFVKDYLAKGLREKQIELFGTGELDETNLRLIGPKAVGMRTAFVYGPDLDNAKNRDFVRRLREKFGSTPAYETVAAYDAMQICFHIIERTGANVHGQAAIDAAKGFVWDSPRGKVSIDPQTREIVQKVYLRQVVDDGGKLVNRAIGDLGEVRPPAN